jgi:Fic family protein
MKLPRRPPPPPAKIWSRGIGPELDGAYLHWDELRHRDPPEGTTREDWWHAIKAQRSARDQPFPLRDTDGKEFVYVMTDSVQRLVHEVDREMSGHVEVPGDVVNQDTRDRYVVSSLMEEAITSSQLEGAQTTRRVAAEMLRTGRPARDRGEQMIVNNYRAMAWIREQVRRPLNRPFLLQLQEMLTEDAIDAPDGAGRLRRTDEPIVVVDMDDGEVLHTPPPAQELEQRLDAMCAFANDDGASGPFIHPVIRAITLHFWLAYDHPFVDGNGRTARALFYWSMLRHGYWLTEFVTISRVIKKAPAQYGRAFQYTETDGNDLTYFVLHQLRCIKQAVVDLFAHLKRKTEETRTVEAAIRDRDFNHRQIALLSHALRHPDMTYTIAGHRTSHQIVYDTARKDLLGLAEKGYLQQRKRGKEFVFSPASNLQKKLSKRGS